MKKYIILVACYCNFVCAKSDDIVYTDEYEHMLFNEWIKDGLKKAGFDTKLCFYGDSHLTGTFVNQSNPDDLDSQSCSHQGNIYIEYQNRTNEFGYGFEIRTKQTSGIIKQGGAIFNSSYVFVEADRVGQVRLGYTNTVADNFIIGGHSLFKGYEGPGSCNFGAFYNQSAGAIISTGCQADDDKAAKIAWYSPIIKGFSAGISFTPNGKYANTFRKKHSDANCDNDGCWDFAHTSAYSKNVLALAGKYEYGSQKSFNAALSICGWFGKGESGVDNFAVRNIRSYGIGGNIGYKDFKIAVGYIDNGKSLLPKSYAIGEAAAFDENRNYSINDPDVGIKQGANAGKVYTYGMSYDFGRLVTYAGYFRSVVKFSSGKSERSVADIITAGAEYNFTRALSSYIEYNNIITGTCDRARGYKKACDLSYSCKNRANMVMIGTKIKF